MNGLESGEELRGDVTGLLKRQGASLPQDIGERTPSTNSMDTSS